MTQPGLIEVVVTDMTSNDTLQRTSLKMKPSRDLYSVNFCGTRKLFVVADEQGQKSTTTTCRVTLKQVPNQLLIEVAGPFRLLPLVSTDESLVFEEIRDGMLIRVHVAGEPVLENPWASS
ncbi:hypothetical protein BIW11_14065 [Tropilaelaps mercedesae]|uniref:Uncharacterized protein n=1 Tax=Tropilaelaps mercedesae TaxID=418985 RepID=A0A1V9WZ50_9ACAR|nr:hypothetical protein BIW11_14065 [Tropilaelaps mercedesae]